MYATLIYIHSITRWLLLAGMAYTLYRARKGYTTNAVFGKADNATRHWTATIAHIQLVLGILLYTQSPLVKYFWHNTATAIHQPDAVFFGLLHISLMLGAIVIVTIGSALAKRRVGDKQKFRTLLLWYTVALVIILIAIPWPFSPLAQRPYLR